MNKLMILIALYFTVVVIAQTTSEKVTTLEVIEFDERPICIILMEDSSHKWKSCAWIRWDDEIWDISQDQPSKLIRVEVCSLCGLIRIPLRILKNITENGK